MRYVCGDWYNCGMFFHRNLKSLFSLFVVVLFFSATPVHAAITDGLVSFWGLNEASGTRVDGVGDNDLSVSGSSVGNAAGKVDSAAQFQSGTTGRLEIANNSSFNMNGGDFSISVWAYLDNRTGTQVFASKYGSGGYAVYYEPLDSAFLFSTYAGGGLTKAMSLGQPSTGTWYHIVGVHDSVANTNTIRINDQYENVNTSVTDQPDNSGPFVIGGFGSGGQFIANGRVDAVGLWNRKLTSGEITALYNDGDGLELTSDYVEPTAPTIETLEADGITQTSAVLNAEIDLGSYESSDIDIDAGPLYVGFILSTDEDIDLDYDEEVFNYTLDELPYLSSPASDEPLLCGTTYYFEAVVTYESTDDIDLSGTNTGELLSFTTLACDEEEEVVEERSSGGGISTKQKILNRISRYIKNDDDRLEVYVQENANRLKRYYNSGTELPEVVLEILGLKEEVAPTTPLEILLPVRDLELGMSGEDVQSLQKFLNQHKFSVAENGPGAAGQETDYFGQLTRTALTRFQVANGVIPSAGYFGSITRAKIKESGLAGTWW